MSRWTRITSLLVFTPLFTLAAQAPITAARNLKQGQKVRAHSAQEGRVEGRFVGFTANPFELRVTAGGITRSLSGVDSLWVHRSRVKFGALIGGVAAGGASAAFWITVCQSDDDGCPASAEWMAGLSAAAVGIGAVIGGFVGAAASGWDLRYAAPRMAIVPMPDRRVGVGVSVPMSVRFP